MHATSDVDSRVAHRRFPAGGLPQGIGRLWLQASGRFDAWINGVMSELRAGLHSAPGDDVCPRTAPGGEWVRYVSLRFDDD